MWTLAPLPKPAMPEPNSPDCAAYTTRSEMTMTPNKRMLPVFMFSPDDSEMQFRYGLQAVQIQDRAIVVCSVRYRILLAGRSFDAVLLAHQETKSSARQEQHSRCTKDSRNRDANCAEKQVSPDGCPAKLPCVC